MNDLQPTYTAIEIVSLIIDANINQMSVIAKLMDEEKYRYCLLDLYTIAAVYNKRVNELILVGK